VNVNVDEEAEEQENGGQGQWGQNTCATGNLYQCAQPGVGKVKSHY
jgi:hypothetical protein